ncbi:MAG: GNAT family N-acetyltransferase [Aureispira sp.]
MIKIQTLAELSLEELLAAFNEAFAEYFVPVQLSKKQLAFKIRVDQVNLAYSVGAFENGQLVGFILHGIAMHQGQYTAYNAGTGVVPAFRGQGITKQLYQYALPLLRKARIRYSVLEVIKENRIAQNIYQNIGFQTLRLVNCYQQRKPLLDNAPNRVHQGQGKLVALVPHKDPPPTWQNSPPAIAQYQADAIQFLVQEQGQWIASLIIYKQTGRILQLYVQSEYRRKGIGRLLLGRAAQFFPDLSIINVDASRKDLTGFFEHLGFECTLQQYEMGLIL